ncbi:EcoRII N-terminal effector-binding domain-containing protein [Pseudarthrobacter phenanthrenivorans]|uniref:EcoRII N-terminal effector-binding domain-containing protein n=1 Tax=Pseudarthrobacter phenanthrenivorans TaxID=361575 RepID=UPI00344C9F18
MRPSEVAKTLTPNDLGLTGSHQAGIAIPKEPDILAFFPSLDSKRYNPDVVLSVFAPETDQYWELRYVYYNNKLHDQGTRNEYRLTGTTLMLRELAASAGDSIAFRRTRAGDMEVVILPADLSNKPAAGEKLLKNGWRMTITTSED